MDVHNNDVIVCILETHENISDNKNCTTRNNV